MRTSFFLLILLVLPPIGLAVARWSVDDGIDGFQADPIAHEVAKRAHSMAWVHRDNPIQRILSPAGRVVAVTRAPEHCKSPEVSNFVLPSRPGASLTRVPPRPIDSAVREYTALVRFYSFFRYPVSDVYISCGGSSASSLRPPEWPLPGAPE